MKVTRKNISFIIKLLTVVLAFGGILASFLEASSNGYSHWAKRLLYFTAQSNIWIALTFLCFLLLPLVKSEKREGLEKWLYLLKYIFTVSITVTCIVFCAFLAPFAGADYNPWMPSSFMTHVAVPILSVIDFFVDGGTSVLKKRHIFSSAIPPFCYLVFAAVLHLLQVDFGRGDTYPYFFLNFSSPAGLFGFVPGDRPDIGSMYWILLFVAMVLGIGLLYAKLHPYTRKEKALKRKERPDENT